MCALAACMLFETFARPSKLLALQVRQVVLLVTHASSIKQCLSFVLHASELIVTGKAGEYDCSVPLDFPSHHWAVPYLVALVEGRPPTTASSASPTGPGRQVQGGGGTDRSERFGADLVLLASRRCFTRHQL